MEDVGIKYFYTSKHLEHIREILKHFSVSQFYCMFFSCLKTAGYNQLRQHSSNRETLNKSVVFTLKQSESALTNNWNIRKYNRIQTTSRSTISEVFFNLFLKIDQAGFYECPNTYDFANTGISLKILNDKGLLVFGSSKKYARWLEEECIGLDNLKPSELLNNSEGLEKVYIMLLRLDTGVYN